MANIKLMNYQIRGYPDGWMLEKLNHPKAGGQRWRGHGYYSRLTAAIAGAREDLVRCSQVDTPEAMRELLEKFDREAAPWSSIAIEGELRRVVAGFVDRASRILQAADGEATSIEKRARRSA